MKCYASLVSLVCFLSVFVLVKSAPFLPGGGLSGALQTSGSSQNGNSNGGGGGLGGLTNILSQIDLPGLLRGINSFVKLVGVFCPPCSQILDNVIQNVTSTAFRVFGRAILQGGGLGGGGGGGGSGGSGGGGNSVSVVLPTFPPDEEDYDEDTSDKTSTSVETSNRLIELESSTKSEEQPTSASNSSDKLFTSNTKEESNLVRRHTRVVREAAESDDQAVAESAPHPGGADDLGDLEDEDRNKRFLPFGGGSGGSGNFLFDVIRNTADRAARMVGTVYRMVAGTQHFSWGPIDSDKPQTDYLAAQSAPDVQLVAGSGATEDSDEKANSPEGAESEAHAKSTEHYSEGIPGPITRLLVIANRGVANLVQDLILRLAQTSERLVNFKARLITSLI